MLIAEIKVNVVLVWNAPNKTKISPRKLLVPGKPILANVKKKKKL
jgi:hypothetical protein